MNLDIYTEEMAKSIWDKAFFMDKIPGAKCVIDFGCADGAMIRYLAKLFPETTFIGYDISPVLIARARSTPPFLHNIMYFTEAEREGMMGWIEGKFEPRELCINFSSVLHEVFSSTGGADVIAEMIEDLHPQYITIRDMYCDEPFPIVGDQIDKIFKPIWDKLPDKYCLEFLHKFGVIMTWKDLTHLLMKLQWINNGWEDEMKENYYSWNIEQFLDLVKDYIPAFEARYQLPYLSEKWKQLYNWYNPDIHTHAQFILRRNE